MFHKKSPKESLDYYAHIVQRDLDLVLTPPEGVEVTSWSWFFCCYALLIVVAVLAVYAWDTKAELRQRFRLKSRFSLFSLFASDDDDKTPSLEGKKGSYFRAQWKEGVICALPWIIGFVLFAGGPMSLPRPGTCPQC